MDRPRQRGKVGVKPTRGPIVQAILDAQDAWFTMRRTGNDRLDVEAQIAEGLRAALRRGTHVPRCVACVDTGWVVVQVDVRRIYGPDAPLKDAVEKCHACGYWERYHEQYLKEVERRTQQEIDSGLVAAATTRRRR